MYIIRKLKLESLTILCLYGIITERGLGYINGDNLTSLVIECCNTDKEMKIISELNNLRHLEFAPGDEVTDLGFEAIRDLHHITDLYIYGMLMITMLLQLVN